jgi:DHA2 family multidrug resistance protein-like MFS transporter
MSREHEESESGPRAGRREWVGLAVIALPCVIYAMDLTVLFLALPVLTRELSPSSSELLWISDIYGFLLAGALVLMGTLGDRIGRRRLLLIGAFFFGVMSVIAAFSVSPLMLIVSRALLGVAGATLAPSTLSLIRSMFHDARQRQFAIGVWITSFSVGAAIGPVVGGVLLEVWWWGAAFLLAVPVMALLLVVGPRLLPEYRDPSPGRFDVGSAVMSLVAVLAVVYGVKHFASNDFDFVVAAAVGLGGLVGFLFVWRQRRLEDPFLDLTLFRLPSFSVSIGVSVLTFFVVGGISLFVSQYLQLVAGMSPLEAGLWLVPSAGVWVVGSMLTPVMTRRFASSTVMAGGLFVAAFGMALMTQVSGSSDVALLIAAQVVAELGFAFVVTLSVDMAVGSAPPARAGAASAISETGGELGGALGIAVLGSIAAAVYRSESPGSDTLGEAVEASLPADALTVAHDAFVSGMQVAATLSAVLIALVGVAAARILRERRRPAAQPAAGRTGKQPQEA